MALRVAAPKLTAFRYRDYTLFWLGGAFSNLGMWALIAGRLWLVHNLTDSRFMLGLVTFAGLGPVFLFSMWGGVIADRTDRLHLLTWSRALFGVLAAVTGALVTTGVAQPWHIIVIAVATGVLLSFDIPSRQALLPNLVPREHLPNAITLYSILMSASAIVGPSFMGPLVNTWGLAWLFYMVGICYGLTVVLLLMVRTGPQQAGRLKGSLTQGLTEGFAYIRRQQVILSLIIMGIVAGTLGMSFRTLLPDFSDNVLVGGGIHAYSNLLLSLGVGGLAGTALLTWLGSAQNQRWLMLLGGVGFGVGLMVFVRTSWLPASEVMLGLVGMCTVLFSTSNNVLVQSQVADEFRGRVMSIHQLSWSSTAIGGLVLGALAQAVDAPFALACSGLLSATVVALMAFPLLRLIPKKALTRGSPASGG